MAEQKDEAGRVVTLKVDLGRHTGGVQPFAFFFHQAHATIEVIADEKTGHTQVRATDVTSMWGRIWAESAERAGGL